MSFADEAAVLAGGPGPKRKVVAPGLSPVRLISSINDFFTIVGQQVLEKQ
jgi:hypothetical protein